MKKNLYNMFVVLVMFMVAAPAAAQSETVELTEEEWAIVIGALMNDECSIAGVDKDGRATVWQHGGFYLTGAAVEELHNFSNNDGVSDTGSRTTLGGEAGLGYRMVRKGWALAGFGEVFTRINGSYHVENREVGTHLAFGALLGIENSHGKFNFGTGVKYLYENAVSENAAGSPCRVNKHKLEPFIRISTKLFTIGNLKDIRVGNKVVTGRVRREVKLFAEGSYNLTNTIDKYWDDADAAAKAATPQLKDNCWTVRLGLQVFIR